jgi:hypothetical protein
MWCVCVCVCGHARMQLTTVVHSIGGPDFLDRPFVEKVWELSANGIVVRCDAARVMNLTRL